MSLASLLKKGGLRQAATAIPATFATDAPLTLPKVARVATVATVAVANLQTTAAIEPAATITVLTDLPPPDVKGLPTTPADGAVANTVRPLGLSPALLAASLALDAQIQAAGHFRNSDENPGTDLDRWCYPKSKVMTGAEIDLFAARLARFTTKGVIHADAESIADKLVQRDRDDDDRRLCLECKHLVGYGRTNWRCGNWQSSGVAIKARDVQLPVDLVQQLQRCAVFTTATPNALV